MYFYLLLFFVFVAFSVRLLRSLCAGGYLCSLRVDFLQAYGGCTVTWREVFEGARARRG